MAASKDAKKKGKTAEPYLKGKNVVYLWAFIGINVTIFLCLFIGTSLTEAALDHFWHRVTMKGGIIAAATPIIAILCVGVLGDTAKARLVFWRWKHPLPGCRAFSSLLKNDPRINADALRAKFGKFPREARAQNALWFEVYRRHSSASKVLESHRVYLLTRDMTAVAAVFLIAFSAVMLTTPTSRGVIGIYALALLAQYLLAATAARNYGNRFALNVIVEEQHA
jgi:hypothetical protein